MLKYTDEFFRKTFSGDNMKEAYLKACKWYASNVVSKDEMKGTQVEFEKSKHSPTVTIHLYASLGEEENRLHHCQICRETHKSFFINEETNCDWCRLKAYQRRTDQQIGIRKQYSKDVLGGI